MNIRIIYTSIYYVGPFSDKLPYRPKENSEREPEDYKKPIDVKNENNNRE